MAVPALLTQPRTVSLLTNPPSYPIGQNESIPLPIDFTARLATGEALATAATASEVSVSLVDVRTGLTASAAFSGNASISTGTLTQTIVGSALLVGRRYRFVAAVKELSTGRTEEAIAFVAAV